MQIMTIFIDQFLSEKSEIDGKANTLAMVFVRYTMDHDSLAYLSPIMIHVISTLKYTLTKPVTIIQPSALHCTCEKN